MPDAARAHAEPAALTAKVLSSAIHLQRACDCGGSAGPSGKCAKCEAEEKLGIRTKLTVNAPGDAYEQEADRVADEVVARRHTGAIMSLGQGRGRARDDAFEAGADRDRAGRVLPTKAASASGRRTVDILGRRLAVAGQGGRALDTATRAAFEPRFGRSLSQVRLHENAAARMLSRDLGARAFTHGNDIYFAAGQLDQRSLAGRRLLAHEITHTLQQGGAGVLRRAPAPETGAGPGTDPGSKDEATPTIAATDVTMIVLENPTGARHNVHYVNMQDGVFAFYRPIFPHDSIHIVLECNFADEGEVEGPVAVRLADGDQFEQSDGGGAEPEITLRVLAEPDTETEARLFLSAPNVAREMEVVFTIGVLPLDIDPVKDTRLRKRLERRTLRQEQRAERRSLRQERRVGDAERDFGAETAGLRREQRRERRAFRQGRREALGAARIKREKGIAAARSAHGKYACSKSQRQNVDVALREAIGRLESALAHIHPGQAPDKYRMDALAKCFNIDPASTAPAELTRLQTRAVDILNIARNSMLVSHPGTVRCGAPPDDCKLQVAAFVEDNVRGNPVTVCQIWLDDNLSFEATKLEPGHERAYALIHEFCHLAGVTDRSAETYLHEGDWPSLPSAEAETMADAFAAFAWYMSSPGLT
jgi:Domain of unknown function (DUF4157)